MEARNLCRNRRLLHAKCPALCNGPWLNQDCAGGQIGFSDSHSTDHDDPDALEENGGEEWHCGRCRSKRAVGNHGADSVSGLAQGGDHLVELVHGCLLSLGHVDEFLLGFNIGAGHLPSQACF